MSQSTYKLKLRIPRQVRVQASTSSLGSGSPHQPMAMDREYFSHWIWDEFLSVGLLGVHEGTLLSADAAEKGLETESWTVDAGEAPRERDWVADQEWVDSELFFETREGAEKAAQQLRVSSDVEVGEIEEQEPQDWDAQWKASFLGAEDGVPVPPFWRILPPWVVAEKVLPSGEHSLKINPGAGFGTGTHETTQLCLQAIGEVSQLRSLQEQLVLDFGSGSGILSIGAALLGAQVEGVEIDPLAIDNATENATLNGVEDSIRFSRSLSSTSDGYRLVIANILRPVLLEFAEKLVQRMSKEGSLILSGLIESDVASVKQCYSALLGGWEPEVRALNEWRALVWIKR